MTDDESPQLARMPWFPSSFYAAVRTWPFIARAAYRELLDIQWDAGSLPASPDQLKIILGVTDEQWSQIWPFVEPKMPINGDGTRKNKRLEAHREKAMDLHRERKRTGKAGSASRWGDTGAKGTMPERRSARLSEARKKGTHTKKEWEILLNACGNCCVKCGIHADELSGGGLCKDHITPIYKGGSDAIDNIQPMCRSCNGSKGPDSTDYRPAGWKNA